MPDPPIETFLTSCSLNGFCQKGFHILMKTCIFDDVFHRKLPALVIFVPVMIRPSGTGMFLSKLGQASEVAEAPEVNEVKKISNG